MKILFFDMEFANGKVQGSIYSFGYVLTDAKFRLVQPQTDILMNPECVFNDYVRKNILAYSLSTVQSASTFPAYYKRLKKLLMHADLAVGFAVGNDTAALRHACERYNLKVPGFKCLDMERLCKKFPAHRQAHGLSGCVEAWCGVSPANQHRSDGDAFATMMLLRAVCEAEHLEPKKLAKLFSDCIVPSLPPKEKKKKEEDAAPEKPEKAKGDPRGKRPDATADQTAQKKRRRRHRHRRRPADPTAKTPENGRKERKPETKA